MTTLQVLKSSLTPHGVVSDATHRAIVACWVVAPVIYWGLAGPEMLPAPWELPGALLKAIAQENLLNNALGSLWFCVEAISLSTVVSFALVYGGAMPLFKPAPQIAATFRFLGLAGFSFASGLWFEGHTRKLVLATMCISFFLVTSLLQITSQVSQDRYDHARTLRMKPWQVWWHVTVRGTLADAVDAVRQNAAISWVMLTTIEGLVRSDGGLGAMLLNQERHMRFATIFALQGMVLCLAFTQDLVLALLRGALFPYADLKAAKR